MCDSLSSVFSFSDGLKKYNSTSLKVPKAQSYSIMNSRYIWMDEDCCSLVGLLYRRNLYLFAFSQSNLYLSLRNHWGFPHLQWCGDTELKKTKCVGLNRSEEENTQWKQLHTEVKWFEIIVLNCPGVVRVSILRMCWR